MKKYIIIAAAAVAALASCAKVETVDVQKEVTFEVANRLQQTKASGSVYDTSIDFGTYAWFTATSGSTNADFMVNETIGYVGGVWKNKVNTFYWPKTGSVSFISYSPFDGTNGTGDSNPAITADSITYTDITAGDIDYLYADKATCSSNVNDITDGDGAADSGFSGVPTLFRHALAKVSFIIKASFLTYTDPTTNTTTTWEVTVNSAQISGFKTTGDLALTLNTDGNTWDKPAGEVWTHLSGATAAQELIDPATYPAGVVLTTGNQVLNPASGYVIPQELAAGVQKLDLNIHIKTTLSNGNIIEEDLVTEGLGGTIPAFDFSAISSLTSWKINQNIIYTISIKPTATTPTGDYDNPNDVIITFDPAVADWEEVPVTATIQL